MRFYYYVTSILFLTIIFLPLSGQISVGYLSTYFTGEFDESAAEIVAYDASSQRLFSVNGNDNAIDIIDISIPENPNLITQVQLSPMGDMGVSSVAVYNGLVAAVVEGATTQSNGKIIFFDSDGTILNMLTVGPLPDMVTFSPNGTKVLVANEGEPDDDYLIDPEGSVSIIDVSGGVGTLTQADVQTVNFNAFDGASLDPSIRIFGNNGMASVSEDLEPEYIAISSDGQTAYVTCQENNCIAIIDISTASVTALVGLGFIDRSLPGFGFDASDKDDEINIQNYPVYGMPQPDAIATYEVGGAVYLVTANEGDERDYDGYSEEERCDDLTLDPTVFPNASDLQDDEVIGRLKITTATGDIDGDGDFDAIYSYGTRSFSIWDAAGNLVFDSGDEIEQIIADRMPNIFNSNRNDNDSFDKRSDDKGPEPSAVEIVNYNGGIYAFIGLERVGGIMIYDISNPSAPNFIDYLNNRIFSEDAESMATLDLGIEDIIYISSTDSPTGSALIVTANEVSGTVSIFTICDETCPFSEVLLDRKGALIATQITLPQDIETVYTWLNDAGEIVAQINGNPYYSPSVEGCFQVLVSHPDFPCCDQMSAFRYVETLDGCCELDGELPLDNCNN